MKYKSLLLDVDGTIVPVGPHTKPTEKVTESLKRAKSKVKISLVSGRSLEWLTDLFQTLELEDPSIINGGSQIIDPKTFEILWEKPISQEDADVVFQIIKMDRIPFIVSDNGVEFENPAEFNFKKPLAIKLTYFDSKDKSDKCLGILQTIPDIEAHKVASWDKDRNYKLEVYITHKDATKQKAVRQLAKLMSVSEEHMIGVGDSRNDIPLLEACGLKIAMGNADDKLKAVADYIAPGVNEDGVAHVIEKFVLSD